MATTAPLTPEQIASWRRAMPMFSPCSDAEIQTLRNMMQAKIDSQIVRDDRCDVKDCGKRRNGHGNDHPFMEKPSR